MVMRRWASLLVAGIAIVAAGPALLPAQPTLRVASPDGKNVVTVSVRDGNLWYSVDREGQAVLLPSRLGFEFRGAPPARRQRPDRGFRSDEGGRDVDAAMGRGRTRA
jgi:alpha-glucosidase